MNLGVADLRDVEFVHDIRIQAVADTPSIATNTTSAVDEDTLNIPLRIYPDRSPDADGSETLSVEIIVPTDIDGPIGTIQGTGTNVLVNETSPGIYLVTADGVGDDPVDQENALDMFLNSGDLVFNPREHWSGKLNGTDGIQVNAISTERETVVGDQLAPEIYGGADNTSLTETVTSFIDIEVLPQPDMAVVKGNAIGPEDTVIPIPVSVTLADRDGSETYVMQIVGGVPMNATLYGEGGAVLMPNNMTGIYELTPEDVEELAILPPLHWSSPVQMDVSRNVLGTLHEASSRESNLVSSRL